MLNHNRGSQVKVQTSLIYKQVPLCIIKSWKLSPYQSQIILGLTAGTMNISDFMLTAMQHPSCDCDLTVVKPQKGEMERKTDRGMVEIKMKNRQRGRKYEMKK